MRLLKARPLWLTFYRRWIKSAFSPSFSWAERIATLVYLLIAGGVWVYKNNATSTLSVELEARLTNLQWQAPAIIFGGIFLFRVMLAPYWIWRSDTASERASQAVIVEYVAPRGFLDFITDYPKSVAKFIKIGYKINSQVQWVTGRFEHHTDVTGDGEPDQLLAEVSRRLKKTKRVAKDLNKFTNRITKHAASLDDASIRLQENTVGLLNWAVGLTTELDELEETKSIVEDTSDAMQKMIGTGSEFKDQLQVWVDNPASQSLAHAARDAIIVLERAISSYSKIVDAGNTAREAIDKRSREIRRSTRRKLSGRPPKVP